MIKHDGCVGCKYEHEDEASPHCDKCTQNSTDKYTPASNADRIRGMTDEELAEFMRNMMDCVSCRKVMSRHDITCTGNYNECADRCKQWLQQPAKEE